MVASSSDACSLFHSLSLEEFRVFIQEELHPVSSVVASPTVGIQMKRKSVRSIFMGQASLSGVHGAPQMQFFNLKK